jgi:redox-sensitive bicupin YhaK (pirin superfamily)
VIELLLNQRPRRLGSFEVGRVLPAAKPRMIGPFKFFDHMGPVDLPRGLPRNADVLPHPHIGLLTVTYLFAGEICTATRLVWGRQYDRYIANREYLYR